MKSIEINLEELYKYAPQFASEKLLEYILEQYEGMEFRILYTGSPDFDVVFLDTGFKEYVDKCINEKENVELEECTKEYARKEGYEAIVRLFDGYEEAVAIIRKK